MDASMRWHAHTHNEIQATCQLLNCPNSIYAVDDVASDGANDDYINSTENDDDRSEQALHLPCNSRASFPLILKLSNIALQVSI